MELSGVQLGLRFLSVCAVAGLYGTASPARAQDAGIFRPTVYDDVTTDVSPDAPAQQLNVTGDPEPLPARRRKPLADPYAPQGISLGGIKLYPSLGIDGLYTSNVTSASSGQRAAAGLHVRPALHFESDWVRHSWQGDASGDFTTYLKKHTVDKGGLDLSSKFRLDIRRATFAEFDAGYILSQTGPEDSELPSAATGNRTEHDLLASAAVTHDFGAFESRLQAGLERQIYENVKLSGGGKEDNSDRNNYTPSLGLRLAYTEPPAVKPFVDVVYAPRFHDEKRDRNGLARNSQGLTASAGVTLDRGPIWSGEAAIVYTVRDYRDASLATNSAFGINGNLTWRPTDLTSVVLTLATDLNETSSATSSGSKVYSSRLDLTHTLRDNVNLLGGLGLVLEKTASGTDKTMTSKLGVEWQLNPDMAWTASYDGTWFNGATSGDTYNEQRVSTGIVLRR
jgi:hypothetical protein